MKTDDFLELEENKELSIKDLFNATLIIDKIRTKINAEIQTILEKAEANDAVNEFNN